jgi:hypothetical protein
LINPLSFDLGFTASSSNSLNFDTVQVTDIATATSTPALFNAVTSGKIYPSVSFTQMKKLSVSSPPTPNLNWTLGNGRVTSYVDSFDGETLIESYGIDATVATSIAYDNSGGISAKSSFDLATNQSSFLVVPDTSTNDAALQSNAPSLMTFTPNFGAVGAPLVQPGVLVPLSFTMGSVRAPAPSGVWATTLGITRNVDVSTTALFAAIGSRASWDHLVIEQRVRPVSNSASLSDAARLVFGGVAPRGLFLNYASDGFVPNNLETTSYAYSERSTKSYVPRSDGSLPKNPSATSSYNFVTGKASAKTETTTTLTASANPTVFGQPVIFTARVTGSSPTGTITFRDGNTVLNTATLVNGMATFTIASMPTGTHRITASYNGNASNYASQTTPVIWPVFQALTTIQVLPHAASTKVFSAQVSVALPGHGPARGVVKFSVNGQFIGQALVNNKGIAKLVLKHAMTGTVTASFLGSQNFAPSISS